VVGLGPALVSHLDASIPGLHEPPALAGHGVSIPVTPLALWCWLRGDDPGELLQRGRGIARELSSGFALDDAVDGFVHDGGRDLTGYEDGTENPKGQAAVDAALVCGRGAGLDGSSFAAVQRWQHDFEAFERLSPREADDAIGRRRSDNEEFAEAPASSHVKRTAQESFTPDAFVLRRSMPYLNDLGAGLNFVAFGCSFAAFEVQLRRMLGLDDGIVDALFRFSRPLATSYFWCPPAPGGRLDLSAVGL
jgi:putative iron-dependent peroxidase